MERTYLTVTALTKYIKRKLETDPHLQTVFLKGEISNFHHHNRGHMYMTIKDEHTRIQAVMFAAYNHSLKFIPENGMKVLLKGEIGVFEPYGQYQFYIHEMEPDGIGSLYLAFEQLKEKLKRAGYFDPKYKKELPRFPEHIGIITSPTGAAVRDIITTLQRRYPIVQLTVIPAIVQGKLGVDSLIQAIERANNYGDFDLLIIGRGGGSIEELWCFNNEALAKAIFASKIPMISAVGHETDHTIADFVADYRAPTPTGAAEIAVPSRIELLKRIKDLKRNLYRAMQRKIDESKKQVLNLENSYAFRYPQQAIQQKEQLLDQHQAQLHQSMHYIVTMKENHLKQVQKRLQLQHPQNRLEQSKKQFNHLHHQFQQHIRRIMHEHEKRVHHLIEKLTLLNPLEIMKRGYSITYSTEGKIVSSKSEVKKDEKINIRMVDGIVSCKVLDVKELSNDKRN